MTVASRPSPLVLLVEDDPGLRQAVVRGLAKAGYRVAAAGGRKEAVELAPKVNPDAVVMDVRLPDGEGPEVAAEIRRHEPLRGVPVLFVTALAPRTVLDSLFPAPVLFKPFTYRQLVASVRNLVRTRSYGPPATDGGADPALG